MTKATTGRIKTENGLSLFYRHWPGQKELPVLLFVHGMGDHSGRYQNPVNFFGKIGYTIYAYDQRGHGRSEGKRAHTESFARLLGDLDRMIRLIRKHEGKERQLFIIAHSFGAQVALTYAARHPETIAGIILSAANIRLAMPIPFLKKYLCLFLENFISWFAVPSGINPENISRDPKVVHDYNTDPLINHDITLRMAKEMLDNQEILMDVAKQLRIPSLFLHGDADQISDPKGTEEFFAACASKDKTLNLYPGFYHEIFNEVDRLGVFRDMQAWLRSRITQSTKS